MNNKKLTLVILLIITLVVLNVFNLIPVSRIVSYLLLVLSTIGHFIFLKKLNFAVLLV